MTKSPTQGHDSSHGNVKSQDNKSSGNWLTRLFNKTVKTEEEKEDESVLEEIHKIEGTPFGAVKTGGHWYLNLGRYHISKPMQSRKEVIQYCDRTDWDMIMSVMMVVADERNNSFRKEIANEIRKQVESILTSTRNNG